VSDVASRTAAEQGSPAAFFLEHSTRLSASASIGPVLDLACGRGRHALAAADLGLSVLAIDRNRDLLDRLAASWRRKLDDDRTDHTRDAYGVGQIETLCAELESQAPPALETARFGAVLVFRYLHRPLFPWIETLVAPGGFILYETFTLDQKKLGWGPRRDAFLLESGELPRLFSELVVEVDEEGPSNDDPSAHTARVLASRLLR
jgi:tellurite methyltransferase